MDPHANLAEQLRLARDIIALEDHETADTERAADMGARLAELVLALHEWQQAGGFSPYAKVQR